MLKRFFSELIDDDDEGSLDHRRPVSTPVSLASPVLSQKSVVTEDVMNLQQDYEIRQACSSNSKEEPNEPPFTATVSNHQAIQSIIRSVEHYGEPDFESFEEYRPKFESSFTQPDCPICLTMNNAVSIELNRYVSRYLLHHQVKGVKWLYQNFKDSTGCILGDDMVKNSKK